jgi:transcriptional regulator with XRE-family HTH domain
MFSDNEQMADKKPERPTDPYEPIDEDWQKKVRAELKRRGWTQKRLADEIGCSQGGVSGMLKKGQPTSRLVRATCAVLNVPKPSMASLHQQELLKMIAVIRREIPSTWDDIEDQIRREAADLEAARKKRGE